MYTPLASAAIPLARSSCALPNWRVSWTLPLLSKRCQKPSEPPSGVVPVRRPNVVPTTSTLPLGAPAARAVSGGGGLAVCRGGGGWRGGRGGGGGGGGWLGGGFLAAKASSE